MKLSKEETNNLIEVLFYVLAGCTALVDVAERMEQNKEIPICTLDMKNALCNEIPMQVSLAVADLINRKGGHGVHISEVHMLHHWLSEAHKYTKEHEDDE